MGQNEFLISSLKISYHIYNLFYIFLFYIVIFDGNTICKISIWYFEIIFWYIVASITEENRKSVMQEQFEE